MALSTGIRLGPYQILAPLGSGGMGEVYKARDTRLDRTVAIKILRDALAPEPEFRDRFHREARAISQLDHPHICALYDVGEQDGTSFLVMQYLDGETLAARLTKGPLPMEVALRHGIEIADALDKAHRHGITHRDLKPGNVMLTKAGARLLDFGLAKLRRAPAGVLASAHLAATYTGAPPLTGQGTILGTLQYMAPEQLEGKEADARTDIFAFGAVLFEMATGTKAFAGGSQASVIAAILERDPPAMSSLQQMTPPALDRVVRKCLAKDPEERWQSAKDLADELTWISGSGSQIALAPPTPAPSGIRARWRGAVLWSAASVLLAAVTGLAIWSLKPSASSPRPVSRLVITLPPGDRLAGLEQPAVAISPDGTRVAYVAIRRGTQQLYLRALDSLEAVPVAATEGAVNPFFSPDSRWLGFIAGGKLKKVAVSGGGASALATMAFSNGGASWGSRGGIVFSPTTSTTLQQIGDAEVSAHALTRLEKGEAGHRWPEILPGGTAVVFAVGPSSGNWPNPQVAIQSLVSGERQQLALGGTSPRYARSGHLVYAQAGALMAVPFDADRLEVTGPPVPVVEGVRQFRSGADYSVSATGSLAYVAGGLQARLRRLVWVDRRGVPQALPAAPRVYRYPRLSPDGQRVAVMIEDAETHIWIYDVRRENLGRFTLQGRENQLGAWTPDGTRIAFGSDAGGGTRNLFSQQADGSGELERLTTSDDSQTPTSWSPDGHALALVDMRAESGYDLAVLRRGDRQVQPLLRTKANEGGPAFSPDGRWLAYMSDESGRPEIYVQPYPGPGGKWTLSTAGGTEPAWNRDGRELFYRNGDTVNVVDVTLRPAFSAGKPRVLFEGSYERTPGTARNYDVSADGQRFLMLEPSDPAQTAPTQIIVVQNWTEELKRLVPTARSH